MVEQKKESKSNFSVTFWGVRGTRMLSHERRSKYGQNTICVEVNCGNRVLVFDAGSGIIELGNSLIKRDITEIDLFLSHAHYDHVEGIPFFQPFYNDNFTTRFWCGRLNGIKKTRDIVDGLMKEPYFPIKQEHFLSKIDYLQISDFETLDIGDGITVKTVRLNHPGGATGYRVEYAGKSFGFITDTTHTSEKDNNSLKAFVNGIDLFAYDCSYMDREFEKFSDFGHSTWEEACRLKQATQAKAMLGLHHMPFRTDDELDTIETNLLKSHPGCGIAKDGIRIEL